MAATSSSPCLTSGCSPAGAPRGETIAGRVIDDSGAAIAGARLTALPRGTREAVDRFVPGQVMLEADHDGRFVFRHLAPGTWTIRGDRRARTQATLDVETGTTDVQFVTSR
ncbi:MAG: carboxypeptidase regulatory-like domain-containing protein [Kofleriaceae bacterium]|nr:MAG: carboxypeptidase regulatory-like domain-containing protein [Kofleriaceae bacterium]MBZ0237257.1 carboxypeptidase-like regulatory domain-containing protein [Kofleriaceae bacterium]